ncbi:MAG: hypothetical protein L3J18_11435 [Candidatus Brocadia sp.]|nr:MAG: hypothetical protein L3J18_11435 [Candidatus Brocadia sp.]
MNGKTIVHTIRVALYQVVWQGNERKKIFRDDHEKNVFPGLLNGGLKTDGIILLAGSVV